MTGTPRNASAVSQKGMEDCAALGMGFKIDTVMAAHGELELAIDLKAAKALGLTIPPSLPLQADTVIQ